MREITGMEYVIGLDIGTTCAKAMAIGADGSFLGQGTVGYPLISNGACIEQSAQDWIDAAGKAIRKAIEGLEGKCCGISMSTQGASTVAVDENGGFIGNALTWMDGRAQDEAAQVAESLGDEYIYKTSGWRINPSLDAAKIRWMQKQPQYAGAKSYITTLEVMNRRLTGNVIIDPTNAAIRQLYNIEQNNWDDKLLEAATVTRNQLPDVLPTGAPVGIVLPDVAKELGLSSPIPVFNGAHDQYCAAIGAGAVHSGDMLLSAGTTWVMMGISNKPIFTPSYIAPGKHPEKGLYGQIASLICSGASLQWFHNNFATEDFDIINREVAQRQEKTKELLFYPYMAGAAYPIWDGNARGVFAGITLEHDRFDFARAVMEGVAFGVRRAMDDFAANGANIQKITIMGGAAKSPVWCQMIADITNIPIERLSQADVCAVGAAVLALRGAGFYDKLEEAAKACVQPMMTYQPEDKQVIFYQDKFKKFERMWNCISKYSEQ